MKAVLRGEGKAGYGRGANVVEGDAREEKLRRVEIVRSLRDAILDIRPMRKEK